MSVEFIDPVQSSLENRHSVLLDRENHGMVGFLVRRGILNNSEQAKIVLLFVAGIFFIISGYITFKQIRGIPTQIKSAQDILQRKAEVQKTFPQLPESLKTS